MAFEFGEGPLQLRRERWSTVAPLRQRSNQRKLGGTTVQVSVV